MSFFAGLVKPSMFTWALGVFTTLVGFYITNVVESLRSGYTAIHYFEPGVGTETVDYHFANVSRSKRIDSARIVIMCADQSPNCFGAVPETDPPSLAAEITTPPNFGRPFDIRGSGPVAIRACLGAIASSRTSVRIAPLDGKATPLMALYDPWSSECAASDPEANLLLLGRYDLHAFFVQHYFTVITWLLAVSGLILALTGIGVVVRGFQKKEAPHEASGAQG